MTKKQKRAARVRAWAVTDCGDLTTGALYASTDRPYLIFLDKELAERRQELIVGKVRRVFITFTEPRRK